MARLPQKRRSTATRARSRSPFAHLNRTRAVVAPDEENDPPPRTDPNEEVGEADYNDGPDPAEDDTTLGMGEDDIPDEPAHARRRSSRTRARSGRSRARAVSEEGREDERLGEERAVDEREGEEAALDEEDALDDDDDAQIEDDSTEDEMEIREDAQARERSRCAAIFRRRAAALNPALAAELAFGSNMPRAEAVRILEASVVGTGRRPRKARQSAYRSSSATASGGYASLRTRMAAHPVHPTTNNGRPRGTGRPSDELLALASKNGWARK